MLKRKQAAGDLQNSSSDSPIDATNWRCPINKTRRDESHDIALHLHYVNSADKHLTITNPYTNLKTTCDLIKPTEKYGKGVIDEFVSTWPKRYPEHKHALDEERVNKIVERYQDLSALNLRREATRRNAARSKEYMNTRGQTMTHHSTSSLGMSSGSKSGGSSGGRSNLKKKQSTIDYEQFRDLV